MLKHFNCYKYIVIFSSLVLSSCTAYRFYDENPTSDQTDVPQENYSPTNDEIYYKNKYKLRTYKSIVKNPNFENGLMFEKRMGSPSYRFSNKNPMYRFDSDKQEYLPFPNSDNRLSNEFNSYSEQAYLLFDSEYENKMDSYFDKNYNYPDFESNPIFLKTEDSFTKIAENDFKLSLYKTKNSSIPNNNNGKAFVCDDELIYNSWTVSEWWRPDNYSLILNGDYAKKEDGTYVYETKSRTLAINPKNGSMRIRVDSGEEYAIRNEDFVDSKNHILKRQDSWSHFLIQQSFFSNKGVQDELMAIFPSKHQKVYVDFDITINACDYTGLIPPESQDSFQNAAQIYLYLLVGDFRGLNETFSAQPISDMWVGMPIFDSRFNVIPEQITIDEGFEGATGKIIYNPSNSEYISGIDEYHGIEMGETYHVHYNVIPLLKRAFEYATSNKQSLFYGKSWDDLAMYYMNYGYELPGSFNLDSTISNLDIYGI